LEQKNIALLWDNLNKIMSRLPGPGILLVTGDGKGKDNIMTIGWVQFGIIWNSPTVSIMVRPSRYSFELLNKSNNFTINVLSEKYNNQIGFCGSNSGSYCDKFKETGLSKHHTNNFVIPSIKEADIYLECQVVHTNQVIPENLNDLFLTKFYNKADYHHFFTGTILNFKLVH